MQPERLHEKYQRLLAAARERPPVTTAVVHPCDPVALESVVEAGRIGLIKPILVGPAAKIRAAAQKSGFDIAISPGAAEALGIEPGQDVEIRFAPAGAQLGPLNE